MRNIDILKNYLKETATEIRKTRQEYKEAQRKGGGSWRLIGKLNQLRRDFRHHHIAYCELRGRTRDQIEQNHREDTPYLSEQEIQKIKDKYAWTEEEIAAYTERIEKRNAKNAA